MAKALVAASFAWPLLLGATVWAQRAGERPAWTAWVYVAASRLCHQLPERSFHTADIQWPVCARCSGLYLSAPIGAFAAALSLGARRRERPSRMRDLMIVGLIAASVPTALTLVVEWTGLSQPSNLVRALAALPLGAAIAVVLVRTAAGASQPIE